MNRNFLCLSALVTVVVSIGPLAGCSDPAEQAHAQQLREHPEITPVGVFDGCEVKYVNRYDRDNSFYLARCGNTTVATQQFDEAQGKSRVHRTRVAITEELKAVDEQRAKLQEEAKVLENREAALSKLTPEEREALGYTGSSK